LDSRIEAISFSFARTHYCKPTETVIVSTGRHDLSSENEFQGIQEVLAMTEIVVGALITAEFSKMSDQAEILDVRFHLRVAS